MQSILTVGLDIAKSVFQVHGVDAVGQVVIRRQLKRRYVLEFFQKLQPCLVGIEACASSHHWSRELQAIGHTVRLMPPAAARQLGWKWSVNRVERALRGKPPRGDALRRAGLMVENCTYGQPYDQYAESTGSG